MLVAGRNEGLHVYSNSKMNRVLLKYLIRPSSAICMRSTYATFSNKKFWNEKKSAAVKRQPFNGFESACLQFIKTTNDLTETSFDAVFMRMCVACRNYSIGKQFLDYLNQSGCQVNTATLARYLELCYHCKEEVKDKSEVERLCQVIKSNSQYLSSDIKESLILGFSITDKWREGFQLLSEGGGISTSLSMNAIVDCFIKSGQIDVAVAWMKKIFSSKRTVHDFIYEHWLRKCADQEVGWKTFFDFLVESGVFLNTSIVQQLKNLLENQPIDPFVGHFTTIDEDTGRCRSCKKLLQNQEISDDEFADLKKGLIDKVLLGTDVYLGSKPDELLRFQKFIQKTAPYDVVIDGLNVAYLGKNTFRYPEALSSVVNYFTNQNLRVLVLTREHLKIRRKATNSALVFATENLSSDDPFLLCSAVQSLHTKFVSEDVFRDHLHRLGDFRLQNIFRRWQHKAQMQILSFDENGTARFKLPRNYRTVSQFDDGCWHIPYNDGTPRYSYELPTTWLCLQPKASKKTK